MEIDYEDLKPLGKTGEKVPAIGMGTWGIGGRFTPDYSKDALWVDALRFGIKYSIEKVGMALIDTAEMYGAGHSEEIVGRAMKEFPRDKVFVVTKVKGEHLRYEDVIKAAKGSLSRLGIKQIDLYLIHWPNPIIPLKETMKAMEKLVNNGLVRFIGVSNFGRRLLEEARSYLSFTDIVVNQVRYSIAYREPEADLLPYCQREGILLMAYTPLEKGALARNPILEEVGRKYNKTAAQVALNWLIAKKNVITIPKSERKERIKENLDAMGWRLSKEDIEYLNERFSA